jgi:hypothetical protein
VWQLADEEQQEEQVEEVEQEEQQQEEQQQEEQQLDSIGGSSRYLYPSWKLAGRWAGVCARRNKSRSKPWQAEIGNPPRYLGHFSTERAAAEAYADAFEEAYGTTRRDDDTADFTTCQSAWEYLIGIMPQHVDKLGVDFSITSLSPDHPRFWAQLAARTWRGEAPPSPEEIQGLVDGWTANRSAEQIMACLVSLWKDESSYTAGAWV